MRIVRMAQMKVDVVSYCLTHLLINGSLIFDEHDVPSICAVLILLMSF